MAFSLWSRQRIISRANFSAGEFELPSMVSLATFIVNLADTTGNRYLKVKLEMALSNKAAEKELGKRRRQVRNQIILALSSKTYQQVRGAPGKDVLCD